MTENSSTLPVHHVLVLG